MDLTSLISTVGPLPVVLATALMTLAVAYDKVRREQLKYRDHRIETLEAEARKALAAKDLEAAERERRAAEWERRYLDLMSDRRRRS